VQKLELNKLLSLVKQCSDQDKDILQGVDARITKNSEN
ncbi:hypothetical protein AC249_AIPGENE19835, partial [Exaiptasia diaphana]